MAEDRVVPHDKTAERAILGAVLLEPSTLHDALAVGLKPSAFFSEAHRVLFASMVRIHDRRETPDFVTLKADLEREKQLEAVGAGYMAGLVDGVPRTTNVHEYARIVQGHATRRDLIIQARATIDDAYAASQEVDELVNLAESRLLAVGRSTSRGEFVTASDWIGGEVFRAVEKAMNEPRVVTGVPTGLAAVDTATRGFQPGDLVIIAARPSVGKTSLALQFALEAARHVFVAFVSMEMSRQLVGFRAVSQEARVDNFRLMTGRLYDHEQRRVGDAMDRLAERQIAIDDTSAQDVSELCAKVRRLAARRTLGALFVDYLQLMHAAGAENRTLEIGRISGRLKGLAKDLGIPVIALSQLTRDNERQNRAPMLSDLRQSGDLEQDADVVILIHRPNKKADTNRYQPNEVVELILAKQRNGAQLTVEAIWDAPTMRFTDKSEALAEQGTLAGAR